MLPADPGVVEVVVAVVVVLLLVVVAAAVSREVAFVGVVEGVSVALALAFGPPLGEDGTDPGRSQDHEHGAEEDLPGPRVGQLGDQALASRCNLKKERTVRKCISFKGKNDDLGTRGRSHGS